MKYKINKRFKDRYTKALYEIGALVEFDDARAAEIVKSLGPDFIEKTKAPKAPKATETPKSPKADGNDGADTEGPPGEEGNSSETGESQGDH